MTIRLLLPFLCCVPIFGQAGRSLVMTPATNGSLGCNAVFTSGQDARLEISISNFTYPTGSNLKVYTNNCVKFRMQVQPTGFQFDANGIDALGDGGAPCTVSPPSGQGPYIFRVQRLVASNAMICEVHKWDSTGYLSGSVPYTSLGNGSSSGSGFGPNTTDATFATNVDFIAIYTTTVPLGMSNPAPTTTAVGDNTNLTFDNTLLDSTAHHNDVTLSSPTYAATPNLLPVAFPRTMGAPSWSNWTSLRAGQCNSSDAQMDGSSSYSMSPTSAAVTYFWQQLTGPTIAQWSSRTTAQPFVCGLVSGAYQFQLTVKDGSGSTASQSITVGSVATDNQHIVVDANPNTRIILGDRIAFGHNPWPKQDERHLCMATGQNCTTGGQPAFINALWTPSLTWTTPAAGTLNYIYGGIGNNGSGAGTNNGTTLSSGITATTLSIPIADAAKLPGLAHLPTWLIIGDRNTSGGANYEMIRVTATTATTGAATLTAGYDGRAVAMSLPIQGSANLKGAGFAWPSGSLIGEGRVDGASTLFASDPVRPLCPAGVPGPPGRVAYSAGTLTPTASSTAITGNGTTWTSGNGVVAGGWIRVPATHGGGTPFIWWANIGTVGGVSSITASRPWPADIDAGPFPYAITAPRIISTSVIAQNGLPTNAQQNLQGCESETVAFVIAWLDLVGGQAQTARPFSYLDGSGGAQGTNGIGYYGPALVLTKFWLRSGYGPAEDLALTVHNNYPMSPEMAGGYGANIPLNWGGGLVGSAVAAAIDPKATVTFADMGGFVGNASSSFLGPGSPSFCDGYDTRDSSIIQLGNAFAATFDTDGTRRAAAQATLSGTTLVRQQGCQRSDSSFSNSNNVNNAPLLSGLTLTKGSATVTGTGIPSTACYGVAAMTVNMTNGSASFTASGGLVQGTTPEGTSYPIIITGTINSGAKTYVGIFFWTRIDATHGTLNGQWPGDSGSGLSATIQDDQNYQSYGASVQDALRGEIYGCTWVSSTQITLNRTWDGPTGTYAQSSALDPGPNQQPFMAGGYLGGWLLRMMALYSPISSTVQSIQASLGTWLQTVGYDAQTNGMYYLTILGRNTDTTGGKTPVEGACSVPATLITAPMRPNCDDSSGFTGTHIDAAEGLYGLIESYRLNPNPTLKGIIDNLYNGIWGSCSMPGPITCDPNIPVDQLSDSALSGPKWAAFLCGVGNCDGWPAVRLGGVAAADLRTVHRYFSLGPAHHATVTLMDPSAAITTVSCTSSPCLITGLDARQGTYVAVTRYYSAGGVLMSVSDPELITPP